MTLKRCARLDIRYMCQVAGVSRSGYYGYIKRHKQVSPKEIADEIDFEYVLEAYHYRRIKKGAKAIKMRLIRMNHDMNLKKIRRLMKKFNLVCPIRKANPIRRMAKALATNEVAENRLERNFRQGVARKTLLTDITYLQYGNHHTAYLSVIKDSSTNKVLAYMPSQSLDVSFVLKTVEVMMASQMNPLDFNVLIHSDQGCHYTSRAFRKVLETYGIHPSMSRRGNCWDNAPQESFFGHMKDELDLSNFSTYEELVNHLIEYFNYYNYDRPQWGLNRMTPHEYEAYLDQSLNQERLLPIPMNQTVIYL